MTEIKVEPKGKVVFITGANRGIGKELVEAFLKEGAKKVYAAVRKLESAQELVKKHEGLVVPIHVDLEKPETIAQAAKEASDAEIVVSNAGVLNKYNAFDNEALDSIKYEMNINVYGLIHMAQQFAPVLKANGGGAFMQLNSVVSLQSFHDCVTYSASKAAAYSITQGLRPLFSEQGTLVVSVHPGPTATEMVEQAGYGHVAEPVQVVIDAMMDSLRNGKFHAWGGVAATKMGEAYEPFSKAYIEA